ncbi:MAG: DUF6676 family protein, partial [Actinomycetota bacterium]|nr:DUF6676 family protein [Actinomycetota bacterium]
FVEASSTADPLVLQDAVTDARRHGWDLSVVALAAEPNGGVSEYAGLIAGQANAGTVVVVAPDALGWASRESQFYPGEFERAWSLIPDGSTEDAAVQHFVRSVLGGPDSVGVMDSTSALWLLLRADGMTSEFTFGDSGDLPIVGDWDCDGIATVGLYRPSTADVFLRNNNTAGAAEISYGYNVDTSQDHMPLVGDFDGDGCDTVSFYRTTDGLVSIYNTKEAAFDELDEAVDFDAEYAFGDVGDLPFVGDFDGDGIDTVGLFRPATGVIYLKNSHEAGPADVEFAFGDVGDLPVAGDWGPEDGIDTVGVYRPGIGTFFFRYTNSAGPADETFPLGVPNRLPLAGGFGMVRVN